MNIVIGRNEQGAKTFFIVSERIEGEKLNEVMRNLTPDEKQGLGKILDGLVDVYVETYDGKRGQVVEFQYPHNMMLGRNMNREATQEKVYLVDLFPVFSYTPSEFKERIKTFWEMNRFYPGERSFEKLDTLIKKK